MPGISIVNKKDIKNKPEVVNYLNSLNILENFESGIISYEKDLFVGWSAYKEYPINQYDYLNFKIIMEGRIYNRSEAELKNELHDLVEFIEADKFNINLSKWIQEIDGDFIIYVIDKENNKLYVFNDIFGRLPLYYKKTKNSTCISRSLKFITDVENEFNFDKLSLAYYLLLGYTLGERTLFSGIKQLRPASLLIVSGDELTVTVLHQFNFQKRRNASYDRNKSLIELERLFSKACLDRFNNDRQNIVTLSGGLDSRMVAACMFKNRISFKVATISNGTRYGKAELDIARNLSNLFNAEFNSFDITHPIGADLLEQLRTKEGMNSLATATLIPFYRKIAMTFGRNINFITGDNGDKLIFTIDKPIKKFKDLDDLANYIIDEHSIISLETVLLLIKISKVDVLNEIKFLLNSFPEEDLTQKYIHFRIIEKPFKFAFQGEDRHRFYFWSLTPFWSIHFFNYIMNCSDKSKIKHKLFGGLIEKFSPEAIRLPYTNFKSSITSVKGKITMFLIYNIYPYIPLKFKGDFKAIFFGGNPVVEKESALLNSLLEQKNYSSIVCKYINLNQIEIQKKFRKIILFNILTLTSAIEYFNEKRCILSKYTEKEF